MTSAGKFPISAFPFSAFALAFLTGMAEKNSWLKKFQMLLDERRLRSEAEPGKLYKFVHFWILVGKSFHRNRCPIRASALSYTTLLALVPMLAVAMSVTSLFLKSEGEQQIETFIQEFVNRMVPPTLTTTNGGAAANPAPSSAVATNAPEEIAATTNAATPLTETNAPSATMNAAAGPISQPTDTNAPSELINDKRVVAAQKTAARYIHEFIQNTYSGTLGAAGVVALFWTAIVMLIRIEETFNDIWGVSQGRDWLSRVTNYLTTIMLTPMLLVAALGLASGPHFEKTRALLAHVPLLEPLISQLLPVLVISVTFALFYKLMPNTKVHFTAALVGGGLAGVSWHVFNLVSIHFATRAMNASKVYGSLALVPLFMLGLYAVWVIVLFGAQVAYAYQNRALYLQEKLTETVNQRGREFVALRLMTCIGQRFHRGLPPPTVSDMSNELGVPSRLVQQVLRTLVAAHLVIEVSGAEPGYTPARPLENINAHHILQAMRVTVGQELMTRDEPVREEIYGEFARIQEAEKHAAASVTMLALVDRAHARLELPLQKPEPGEMKLTPAMTPKVQRAAEPIPPKPVDEVKTEPVHEAHSTPPEKPIVPAQTESAPPSEKPSRQAEEDRGFPL